MATRFLFCLLVLLIATVATAENVNQKLTIGQTVPQFHELPGIDGKVYSLPAILKDAKCVVLVIASQNCPIAQAYEERIVQFVKDYEHRKVKVVAIDVEQGEPDKLATMKTYAEKKEFNFAYLYDASQKSARDLGAAVTPEFFVMDAAGRLAYTGAMDDHMTPSKVKQPFLRNAVDAILAGKPVAVSKTRRSGCSVNYEK